MTAPQLPFNTSNAKVYPVNASISAQPASLALTPPEGFKYFSLQFLFNVNLTWYLNLTGTVNPGSFSAIRALYVDNTQSIHDIKIVSPGTNCLITVPSNSSGFYPILSIPGDLSLYVASTATTTNSDITNIYILNSYVPPSDYPEYQKVLTYGLNGANASNIVPIYTANSVIYSGQVHPILNFGNTASFTAVNNGTWYITSIYIDSVGIISTLAQLNCTMNLQIFEAGSGTYILNRTLGPYSSLASMPCIEIDIDNIDYISKGGVLTINYGVGSTNNIATPNITAGNLNITIIGGSTV